jgi:membrane associated rhomboid family serine protease
VIGASGAIAAVMGAYLVWWPHARVLTLVFIVIVPLRAMWVLLAWFVLQFFTNPNSGVAWMAHVTGFVYGVIVALLVSALTGRYRSRPAPQQRYYY